MYLVLGKGPTATTTDAPAALRERCVASLRRLSQTFGVERVTGLLARLADDDLGAPLCGLDALEEVAQRELTEKERRP